MNHADIHARMKVAATIVHLPVRHARWTGSSGGLAGRGTGSSLEFQDQRPYAPGDDPRHINWQAHARTGTYTLKLWREEVSPRIDLVLDHSPSMRLGDGKARRTWELTYFTIESALRAGGQIRVIRLSRAAGHGPEEVPLAQALAHDWPATPREVGSDGESTTLVDDLSAIVLRPGALRILVSDLLDPSPPKRGAALLAGSGGRAIVLAPTSRAESEPDWSGNVEFEDCETGKRRLQRVDEALIGRYRQAYGRHFAAWREASLRHGIGMARIGDDGDFLDAIRAEAIPMGVLEAD